MTGQKQVQWISYKYLGTLICADIERAVLSNRISTTGFQQPDFTKLKLISEKDEYNKSYEFSSDGRFHLSGDEILPTKEISRPIPKSYDN